MSRSLKSLARIAIAVVIVVGFFVVGVAWVFRQPNYGSFSFPGMARADASRLEAHVRFLASPEHPRDHLHPEGLERSARYIMNAFEQTRAVCSDQPFAAQGLETRNIIARFGPQAGQLVVVGAHYDACGAVPAADDNASGVAGLLELARLLDSQPLSSPVELVAFSTEEPPFFGGPYMGSAVHARALADSRSPVRAMISLEMIGFFSPRQPRLGGLISFLYPRNGHFIALVGRWQDRNLVRTAKKCFRGATDVQAVSYSGPTGPGADLSDHRNYWAAGYPAIMVTDTAFLRNANYHCATDTADTLDYTRMAGVVDGVLSTIVSFADGS